MVANAANPLAQYYRQPAIYLKLPSDGRWWEEGALDMPVNRELPIFPMSARDEIVLKTPDALMNGQGVVDVIQSCCPNIRNAWRMPAIDVDAVLIAIRIATYGNNMSFDSDCPHCRTRNTHEIDLGGPLASISCPDFSSPVVYQDLKIKLRPQYYFASNQTNITQFEEQKILNTVNNSELDAETKSRIISESMQKVIDLGLAACANSTEYIELPDGSRVSNNEILLDFYRNAEIEVVKLLQERIGQIAEQTKIAPLDLECAECHSQYRSELMFDFANFFGQGF